MAVFEPDKLALWDFSIIYMGAQVRIFSLARLREAAEHSRVIVGRVGISRKISRVTEYDIGGQDPERRRPGPKIYATYGQRLIFQLCVLVRWI